MNGFGAAAYRKVGLDTGVQDANPHELVLMLFEGALEAVRQAQVHMAAERIAEKGTALGKAVRIVEEGLKASVDRNAGGALAGQLVLLYEYITMRLLQGNLRNDPRALAEVLRLLEDLHGAWNQIRHIGTSAAAAPASQAAAPVAPTPSTSPSVRFFDGAYPQPLRRLASA